MYIRKLLIILTLILFSFNLAGMETLVIQANQDEYIVGNKLEIFKDTEKKFEIEDILSGCCESSFIKSTSDNPGFHDHHSVFWLRFQVQNEDIKNNEWILALGNNNVAVFDLYLVDENKKIIEYKPGGSLVDKSLRSIDYEKILHKIKINYNEKVNIYIKVDSKFPILLNLSLQNLTAFISNATLQQYLLGLYYGIALVLFIYSIFNFIGLKNKNYLLYGLYIITIAILLFCIDGKTYRYLTFLEPLDGYRFLNFILATSSYFGIYYTQSFLMLKKFYPTFNRFIAFYKILLFTSMLATIIFPLEIASMVMRFIPIPTIILVITSGVLAIRAGYIPAKLFLLAFSCFGIGATTSNLVFELAIPANAFTLHAIHIGSGLEATLLMLGLVQQFRILKKEKAEAQEKIIEQLQENEKLKDKVNRELEDKVAERTLEINEKNKELFQKNKDILDSIYYAKKIQEAILPEKTEIFKEINNAFILYEPKDIVSGDFYYFSKVNGSSIIAAVDCTGHGVPGAFMSMIGCELLNKIVSEKKIINPAEILDGLDDGIREALKQQKEDAKSKDGMDIALINLSQNQNNLQFAGAHNSLYLIRKKTQLISADLNVYKIYESPDNSNYQLFEIRANRAGIGGGLSSDKIKFTNHSIELKKADTLYLFSDGFSDQFGGFKNKKYTSKRFKDFLLTSQETEMKQQEQLLKSEIEKWRGTLDQIDDVLVIGIRF